MIGYKAAFYKNDYNEKKVAIVILDIPTFNNPNTIIRQDIVNREFAKHRCQKAFVLKIMDLKTKKTSAKCL